MTKLESALTSARNGWAIFPTHNARDGKCSCRKAACHSPGKHPRTRNGVKDATRDEKQIREWWKEWPSANIAGSCDGLVVFDVDVRDGKRGMQTLASLENQHGRLQRKLVQRTGSGGLHIVFAARDGVAYPGTAGEHIEIKSGDGAYIMLPGSDHESGGIYEWEKGDGDKSQLPKAPDWIARTRNAERHRDDSDLATIAAMRPKGFTRKQVEMILRHIDAEKWCEPRNDGWLKVGQALHHEFEGNAEGLEIWNGFSEESNKFDPGDSERVWDSFSACSDPFTMASLKQEAKKSDKWDEDRFRDAEDDAEVSKRRKAAAIKLYPYADPDASEIPRRDFLYGAPYIRGFVSALVAPGGAAKTSLTITEALSMASGRDLLNINDGVAAELPRALNVCLWNLEDDIDEMERRIKAAQIQFADALKGADVKRRLYVNAATETLKLGRAVKGVAELDAGVIKGLIAALREAEIDVLIVDPFISSHGVPESDNDAIDLIVKAWARIAREAGCSVTLVHHVRKGPAGVEREVSIEDARGASALVNACRFARVINRMSKDDAPGLGVPAEWAWAYLRVDPGKANLAPPGAATWRHLRTVDLRNGSTFEADDSDRIGVVEAWTPPDLSRTSRGERERIVEAMGGQAWRVDSKAADWVGVAFADALGLDLADRTHRAEVGAKVKAALNAGWMAKGVEKIGGKDRPIVRAKAVRQRREISDLLG